MKNILPGVLILMTTTIAGASEVCREPIQPTQTIHLFDGKSLDSFYTWLVDYKREDPKHVFTVVDQVDGAPAIRISGELFGGLTTQHEYANYHLIAECRWGLITWGNRKNAARDSGILLHGQGEDGSYLSKTFNGPWMRSIEFQVIEGGMGDLLVLGAYTKSGERIKTSVKAPIYKDRDGETVWNPEGELTEVNDGRINWFGRDVDWDDKLAFRGKEDLESPLGEWTRLEAICDKNLLRFYVNGTLVNEATSTELISGKILIQSEGAEIFFRRLDLEPLGAR